VKIKGIAVQYCTLKNCKFQLYKPILDLMSKPRFLLSQFWGVALLSFMGTALLAQPSATEKKTIDNLLEQGQSLFKALAIDSAGAVAKKAVSLSKQINYLPGQASGYDLLAEIMLQNGRMSEVRYYDSLLLPVATQIKDSSLLINIYNRNGIFSMERGKTKEAEQNYQLALDIGLDKRQSSKTAEVYSNLGSLYLATGDKDKAVDWFFKALRLYELNRNEKGRGETYSNISSVYYLMGRVNDAISFQKNSIAIREDINDISGLVITHVNIGQLYILKDSFQLALQYLKQSVLYADRLNNPKLKGSAYSGMSAYYSRTKDYKTALEWQSKAIPLFEETDNKPLLSRLYVAAGNLANATNDSVKAVEYYNKALALALLLGNKDNISNANEKLSSFYQSRNDPAKSFQYYKQHILYKDSIAATSAVAKVEEIRTKYETEKKDNEIAKLYTEQRIRQLEIEKQKAVIDGNKLVAKQKENEIKLLSQQRELQEAAFQKSQEELEKQLLVAQNNEQELRLSQQELKLSNQEKELQEKELKGQKQFRNFMIAGIALLALLTFILFNRYKLKRKLKEQKQLLDVRNSISRNLHDDIGASLSNINILNELTRRNIENPEKATTYLARAGDDIQRISESLSDIVWNINPQYDNPDNLFIRMKRYAADMFDGRNIEASISFPAETDNLSMPMDQRRDFYLIFKEAVNNLVKYSKATKAVVEVQSDDHTIRLKVADNGNGFDQKNTRIGNGLQNMKQRAEQWKGKLNVESAPGKGTTVLLDMKINS
jgi:two-component system sensor histidine kinase UhpB